jgi:hypothetical protein
LPTYTTNLWVSLRVGEGEEGHDGKDSPGGSASFVNSALARKDGISANGMDSSASKTHEELGCVALFRESQESSGSGVDARHSDGKDRDGDAAEEIVSMVDLSPSRQIGHTLR